GDLNNNEGINDGNGAVGGGGYPQVLVEHPARAAGKDGSAWRTPTRTAIDAPPVPPADTERMAPPKAPMAVYHELRREKKLRLSKFGLDDPKLAVKVWLVAMKNELRRQATVLKTEWRENEVFIGMVANLEG
ncbi:hypothetical protein L914_03013, partial [Phytophthora nicotianae]